MKTPKTSKEIEEEFKAEFIALLKKYNATLEICEQPSYAYSSGIWEAEITLNAEYDKENNITRDYHYFKIPNYLP